MARISKHDHLNLLSHMRRHEQSTSMIVILLYNRNVVVLLFGGRQRDLIAFLGTVLDPWMIENVRCREATAGIGDKQTRHQILGLVRDLTPLVLWKRVISVAYAFEQSTLHTQTPQVRLCIRDLKKMQESWSRKPWRFLNNGITEKWQAQRLN